MTTIYQFNSGSAPADAVTNSMLLVQSILSGRPLAIAGFDVNEPPLLRDRRLRAGTIMREARWE